MFLTDMQYVSLLVNYEATAFDVVKMVLEKSNASEDPECYRICEINEENNGNLLLYIRREECLLLNILVQYYIDRGITIQPIAFDSFVQLSVK